MLIALIVYLQTVLGGGAEPLEDRLAAALADAGRLTEAVEIVARMQALEADLAQQVEAASMALRDVHARYDATREDYLAATRELEQCFERTASELISARAQLAQVLTEDEWRVVFPAEAGADG